MTILHVQGDIFYRKFDKSQHVKLTRTLYLAIHKLNVNHVSHKEMWLPTEIGGHHNIRWQSPLSYIGGYHNIN